MHNRYRHNAQMFAAFIPKVGTASDSRVAGRLCDA
jgi:hypothetical protein